MIFIFLIIKFDKTNIYLEETIMEQLHIEYESFSFYCYEWLKRQKIKCKQTTYAVYFHNMNKYIIPYFKYIPANNINNEQIQKFSQYLLFYKKYRNGNKLKPATINNILTVLNQTLKFCEHEYGIHFDKPVVVYFHNPQLEFKILNRNNWNILQAYLIKNINAVNLGILIGMYTGMRIGEICALQWKDISDDGTISISKTLLRIKNVDYIPSSELGKTKVVIDRPKSMSSIRYIPLSSYLYNISSRFRNHDEDYVITGSSKYMEPRTLQYKFKHILKKTGLPDYNFHILRHTFATYSIEANIDIKSLSEILGHSSVKTTLSIYVHSSIELKREYMNMFTHKMMN